MCVKSTLVTVTYILTIFREEGCSEETNCS